MINGCVCFLYFYLVCPIGSGAVPWLSEDTHGVARITFRDPWNKKGDCFRTCETFSFQNITYTLLANRDENESHEKWIDILSAFKQHDRTSPVTPISVDKMSMRCTMHSSDGIDWSIWYKSIRCYLTLAIMEDRRLMLHAEIRSSYRRIFEILIDSCFWQDQKFFKSDRLPQGWQAWIMFSWQSIMMSNMSLNSSKCNLSSISPWTDYV